MSLPMCNQTSDVIRICHYGNIYYFNITEYYTMITSNPKLWQGLAIKQLAVVFLLLQNLFIFSGWNWFLFWLMCPAFPHQHMCCSIMWYLVVFALYRRTSKNQRKAQRKKWSLKEGSKYEDLALLDEMKKLIARVDNMRGEPVFYTYFYLLAMLTLIPRTALHSVLT